MAKRIPKRGEPIDIFADDRLHTAMSAAIAPAPVPAVVEPVIEPEPPTAADREAASTPPPPLTLAPAFEPPAILAAVPEPESPRETRVRGRSRAEVEPAHDASPIAAEAMEANVGFKFRVPQSLRSDFESFKAELSAALGGVRLDDSNLARPILERFLVEERDAILQVAKENRGRLRRPANRDAVAMAEFDDAIGQLFREASPPRRRTKRLSTGEA